MNLVVVTATTNPERARPCVATWGDVQIIAVVNRVSTSGLLTGELSDGRATMLAHNDYLGVVPAFRRGVDFALEHTDAAIIACLHDDVEILDPKWQEKVLLHFDRRQACGLAGFGGAIGLGSDQIYKTPYQPMQLARIGFRSNLIDAEVHGVRQPIMAEQVACLDGFSQIGRREFWRGLQLTGLPQVSYVGFVKERPLAYLEDHGIIHHAYDSMLGCIAKRHGWETWYLPVRCRHLGGQTAVGDRGYAEWAKTIIPNGDHGFWEQSHRRFYDLFADVLPLRV